MVEEPARSRLKNRGGESPSGRRRSQTLRRPSQKNSAFVGVKSAFVGATRWRGLLLGKSKIRPIQASGLPSGILGQIVIHALFLLARSNARFFVCPKSRNKGHAGRTMERRERNVEPDSTPHRERNASLRACGRFPPTMRKKETCGHKIMQRPAGVPHAPLLYRSPFGRRSRTAIR